MTVEVIHRERNDNKINELRAFFALAYHSLYPLFNLRLLGFARRLLRASRFARAFGAPTRHPRGLRPLCASAFTLLSGRLSRKATYQRNPGKHDKRTAITTAESA